MVRPSHPPHTPLTPRLAPENPPPTFAAGPTFAIHYPENRPCLMLDADAERPPRPATQDGLAGHMWPRSALRTTRGECFAASSSHCRLAKESLCTSTMSCRPDPRHRRDRPGPATLTYSLLRRLPYSKSQYLVKLTLNRDLQVAMCSVFGGWLGA
jgi:hypothetical protein